MDFSLLSQTIDCNQCSFLLCCVFFSLFIHIYFAVQTSLSHTHIHNGTVSGACVYSICLCKHTMFIELIKTQLLQPNQTIPGLKKRFKNLYILLIILRLTFSHRKLTEKERNCCILIKIYWTMFTFCMNGCVHLNKIKTKRLFFVLKLWNEVICSVNEIFLININENHLETPKRNL